MQSKYFCVNSSGPSFDGVYRELISTSRFYRTIAFIFLITISNIALSQQDTVFIKYNTNWDSDSMSYTQDTIFFEAPTVRNYLMGTTVLPGYSKYITMGYGLELIKIEKSNCQDHSEKIYKEKDKINSIIRTDSTLIIDVNIISNCCFDFLCEPEIIDENTLNLKYTGYGSLCGCNCCFGLVFHFNLWRNSEDLKKIKFIAIGNEPTSIQDFPE